MGLLETKKKKTSAGKGLLAMPPKSAFTRTGDAPRWMQMDPQEARTRKFLEDRSMEREAKQADTMGLGTIATAKDIAGGIPQYLIGEGLSAAGVDPASLLMRGAGAMGVDPMYGLAAGGLLLGAGKLKKAGKAAAHEAFLLRQANGLSLPDNPKKAGRMYDLYSKASSGLRRAMANMTPLEQSKVLASPDTVRNAERLLEFLPMAEQMAAGAQAGAAKKGWYEASAKALTDVFGWDAPRFAALLSAQSPQTSVESNLRNALSTWVNWEKAGRPTDPRKIKAVLGASVQGNKGEDSVLDAWVNNSIVALATPDVRSITLSGPKVDSFRLNLLGESYRTTMDAWMANGFGLAQDIFGGKPTKLQQSLGDPGMTAEYATASARLRQGGKKVGMNPAESQETFWSVVMPMYEEAKRLGIPAQELLNRGLLTNRLVRGTPDFSSLFKTGENRQILERGGYGDKLDAMRTHIWPDTNLDTAPELTPTQQRHLMAIAKTLDETATLRGNDKRALSGPPRQRKGQPPPQSETVAAHSKYELIPGAGVGVGGTPGATPAIVSAPVSARQAWTSLWRNAMSDYRGRDILLDWTLPGRTSTTKSASGNFNGPHGLEFQPALSTATHVGVDYDAKGMPSMNAADRNTLQAVERLRGILTQQHGTPFNAIVGHPQGTSAVVTRKTKTSTKSLQSAMGEDPNMFYADTGRGVAAIEPGDYFLPAGAPPMTENRLHGLLSTFRDPKYKGSKAYPGFNIGQYVDNSEGWAQPMGSGTLTDLFLDEYDKAPPLAQRGLDRALQHISSRIQSDVLPKIAPEDMPRSDVQNFYDLGKRGVKELKRGRAAGVALPAIGFGAFGLQGLLGPSSVPGGDEQ